MIINRLCACVKLILTMYLKFPVTTHTLTVHTWSLLSWRESRGSVSQYQCNTSSSGVHYGSLHKQEREREREVVS